MSYPSNTSTPSMLSTSPLPWAGSSNKPLPLPGVSTKGGAVGPRVLKVTLTAGDSDGGDEPSPGEKNGSKDEFVESTKAPGAFLKGKSHKGYYLYLDRDGYWQRVPVFAHENYQAAKAKFEEIARQERELQNSKFKAVGFLQTGCSVKLLSDVTKDGKAIAPAGIYRMNTLQQNGRMKLTAQNGVEVGAVVQLFIAAGLQRIDL